MKLTLVVNQIKDSEYKTTTRFLQALKKQGIEACLLPDLELAPLKTNDLNTQSIRSSSSQNLPEHLRNLLADFNPTEADIFVSLGGDGTFLATAHLAYAFDKAVIGVNLGSLGFLTSISKDSLDEAAKALVSGNYVQERRMLLELSYISHKTGLTESHIALNDILLCRGAMARILPISLSINGKKSALVRGDGVLVSSPTGSTGYAMAAGGAIVDPTMEMLQVTAICPHNLHNRPYILSPHSQVSLEIDTTYPFEAVLAVDGRLNFAVSSEDKIKISKAQRSLVYCRLHETQDFFSTLPKKLHGRSEF